MDLLSGIFGSVQFYFIHGSDNLVTCECEQSHTSFLWFHGWVKELKTALQFGRGESFRFVLEPLEMLMFPGSRDSSETKEHLKGWTVELMLQHLHALSRLQSHCSRTIGAVIMLLINLNALLSGSQISWCQDELPLSLQQGHPSLTLNSSCTDNLKEFYPASVNLQMKTIYHFFHVLLILLSTLPLDNSHWLLKACVENIQCLSCSKFKVPL